MTLCQKTFRMQKVRGRADRVARAAQLVGDIIFLLLVVYSISRWTLALPDFPSLVDRMKDPLLRQLESPKKVPRPRNVTRMPTVTVTVTVTVAVAVAVAVVAVSGSD
jgi:hypothetical protein